MAKFGTSLKAFLIFPCLLGTGISGEKIAAKLNNLTNQVSAQIEVVKHYLISATPAPKTYYVSAINGNDSNNGLSTSTAFKTIQVAANLTNPGDTVLIMNGTYTNGPEDGQVVYITRSGTANAWITFKAYPGNHPKIQHNVWDGILLYNNASYIEINGLEIQGNNANVTLSYAQSQSSNGLNPLTNGDCITIDGRGNGHPHHIRILNNQVHDCGGAGISSIQADYVTISGNQVFNNAWYSVYGNSGISMWQNWRFDSNQGYKMFVENNKVYNNREYIPWIAAKAITDGNGITIDDSRNTQNNSKLGAYTGRTFIANNLVYKNGGAGINFYLSDHVDAVNNTTYENTQSPEINGGQICANTVSDIRVFNNILGAISDKYINKTSNTSNVAFDYNLYSNGSSANVTIQGAHDLFGNPKFVNSSSPDLRLQYGSPAIDKGFSWTSITTDFAGNHRPSGKRYDIGAYEYQF